MKEEIAKLASRAKFSDFFVGSIFCKVTYPIGHRHFAKNRIQRKKRKFGSEYSFAIPSKIWNQILLALFFSTILCGCQKSNKAQRPSSDDFESLTGRGTPSWQYVQTNQDLEHVRFFTRMYDLRKGLLNVPADVYRIPSIVHFIWIGPKPFPRESVENVRTWMGKHPDWTFYFWTDRERPTPYPGMKIRFIKDLQF